jgi:hypothetical protein
MLPFMTQYLDYKDELRILQYFRRCTLEKRGNPYRGSLYTHINVGGGGGHAWWIWKPSKDFAAGIPVSSR